MSRWSEFGAVRVAPAAVEHLQVYARRAHPLETGGILLGYRRNGAVLVVSAVEIRDPASSRHSYVTDETAIQAVLDDLDSAGGIGYVGPWHVHPGNVGHSLQDRRALRRISKQYASPIASIVIRRKDEDYQLEARVAAGRLTRVGDLTIGSIAAFPGDVSEMEFCE